MSAAPLRIAVSKGRILDESLPLLEAVGIAVSDPEQLSRQLILNTTDPNLKLIVIRATDVPTFVEYGAAEIGIAGRDVLIEHAGNGLYELLDLDIARCRMMVAAKQGCELPPAGQTLRVATKYTHTAMNYFAGLGHQVDVVKLYGSMELAPLVGLADFIVDLVDTGNTLRANGLVALQEIYPVTSRLVVNRAAMKMDHERIMAIVQRLQVAVAGRRGG